MPYQCKEVRDFVTKLMDKIPDRKRIVIILQKTVGTKTITKFKVKTSSGLYTLIVPDRSKAVRLEKALPVHCEKKHIGRVPSKKQKL